MNETGNQTSIRAEAVPMPDLNPRSPKVALNRWRRWLKRLSFVGDPKRAGYVDCALRNLDRGRNDKDAELYRQQVVDEVEKFKATI